MGSDTTQLEDKNISLTIPLSMYNWLNNEGKLINRSELFRQAVKAKMNEQEGKVRPEIFLISIMGLVFSITLLGIAVTPSPINIIARAVMALLAGFLAISTSITYLKERKKLLRL